MVLDLRGERRDERAAHKKLDSENGLRFIDRGFFVLAGFITNCFRGGSV